MRGIRKATGCKNCGEQCIGGNRNCEGCKEFRAEISRHKGLIARHKAYHEECIENLKESLRLKAKNGRKNNEEIRT